MSTMRLRQPTAEDEQVPTGTQRYVLLPQSRAGGQHGGLVLPHMAGERQVCYVEAQPPGQAQGVVGYAAPPGYAEMPQQLQYIDVPTSSFKRRHVEEVPTQRFAMALASQQRISAAPLPVQQPSQPAYSVVQGGITQLTAQQVQAAQLDMQHAAFQYAMPSVLKQPQQQAAVHVQQATMPTQQLLLEHSDMSVGSMGQGTGQVQGVAPAVVGTPVQPVLQSPAMSVAPAPAQNVATHHPGLQAQADVTSAQGTAPQLVNTKPFEVFDCGRRALSVSAVTGFLHPSQAIVISWPSVCFPAQVINPPHLTGTRFFTPDGRVGEKGEATGCGVVYEYIEQSKNIMRSIGLTNDTLHCYEPLTVERGERMTMGLELFVEFQLVQLINAAADICEIVKDVAMAMQATCFSDGVLNLSRLEWVQHVVTDFKLDDMSGIQPANLHPFEWDALGPADHVIKFYSVVVQEMEGARTLMTEVVAPRLQELRRAANARMEKQGDRDAASSSSSKPKLHGKDKRTEFPLDPEEINGLLAHKKDTHYVSMMKRLRSMMLHARKAQMCVRSIRPLVLADVEHRKTTRPDRAAHAHVVACTNIHNWLATESASKTVLVEGL
jgi:hypothetical protein